MRYNRLVPYSVVAATAWMIGGVCGYGFSPSQRNQLPLAPLPALNSGLNADHGQPVFAVINPESARKPALTIESADKSVTLPIVSDGAVNSVEAFRLHVSKGWPVVVVRTIDEESVWYVQDGCEQVDATLFTCSAIFGNASTPAGTKFELAGIVTTSAEEARQFTPGTILRELPGKMLITPVVTLVRR